MSNPKVHHYVPQFHLRRFADEHRKVWVWDRLRDRVFQSMPASVAAQTRFYWSDQLECDGSDPLEMEKQLSDLETGVAMVTSEWLERIPSLEPGEQIPIPTSNREAVAQFLAVQSLRTRDTRDLLAAFAQAADPLTPLQEEERRRLHIELMWDEDLVAEISTRITELIWVFAVANGEASFITSDNPIAFRTIDNRRWLRLGILCRETYLVYPLSLRVIMYGFPKGSRFDRLIDFDGCRSPVLMDAGMVDSENSGQVFMATRFVISGRSNFHHARAFAASIRSEPLHG